MKPLKYTVAALALIAAASFTQSAQAAGSPSAGNGDVMLGVYDTDNDVTSSYELNLGTYSTLTNGETFNLGSSLSNLLTNGGDDEFALFATGGNSANGAGNLSQFETGISNLVPNLNSGNDSLPIAGNQFYTDISTLEGGSGFNGSSTTSVLTGTSSNGTSFGAGTIANSNTSSFANQLTAGGGSFAFADGSNYILEQLTTNAGTEFDLFTNNSDTATEVGTFTFSGTDSDLTLTYDTLAAPEPSAYALGLCAVALFWVLKRRSSVA